MCYDVCQEKMADPDIERWKQYGIISAWHYVDFPKNYCGYHLTADSDGCAFLLGLFERFRSASFPARKLLTLSPPSQQMLAVPNCHVSHVSMRNIEFRSLRDYSPEHWAVTASDGKISIEVGCTRLADLEKGIHDILNGDGDWPLGSERDSLWFWWRPQTKRAEQDRAHQSTFCPESKFSDDSNL